MLTNPEHRHMLKWIFFFRCLHKTFFKFLCFKFNLWITICIVCVIFHFSMCEYTECVIKHKEDEHVFCKHLTNIFVVFCSDSKYISNKSAKAKDTPCYPHPDHHIWCQLIRALLLRKLSVSISDLTNMVEWVPSADLFCRETHHYPTNTG